MVGIEVASRGNTPDQLQEKVLDYLAYGVAEVCVIDPKTRTMLIHRPDETPHMVGPDIDYRCELIDVTFTPAYRTEVA